MVVDDRGLVESPHSEPDAEAAVRWLLRWGPELVGVDSPRSGAPEGERSRPDERALARAGICGVRYTPDDRTLNAPHATGYYDWILNGLELYEALAHAGLDALEVYPTASWTVWGGARPSDRTRAVWSGEILARLGLAGVPDRTSQDARDAIAAALTARLHSMDRTRAFGEIVVPAY